MLQAALGHAEIAARFNSHFAAGRHGGGAAVLIGGAAEPLYLPATSQRPAIIRYTLDYPQSALHEIAHWCLATPQRRALVDYGMWYLPPPRSARDQARFYAAEVPVQALEMLMAGACGLHFHCSVDNPGVDDPAARSDFEARVRQAAHELCCRGPSELARSVLQTLNPNWQQALQAAPAGMAAAAG
ncbi:MAG: elongation factor P hydroxylase [Pseudomonadales bacterium]